MTGLNDEALLVGQVLANPALWPSLAGTLRAEDFSDPRHRAVWNACAAACGMAPIPLDDALRETGLLDAAGGTAYLNALSIAREATALDAKACVDLARRVARRRNGATPSLSATDRWEAIGRPPAWLIDAWLPLGRVALLSGQGGLGKSRLALMLAAGVAGRAASNGGAWMAGGPKVAQEGAAVFCSWEDSRDDIRHRLGDWPDAAPTNGRSKGQRLDDLLGSRLGFIDCAGCGPTWGPAPGGGRLTAVGQAIREEAERRKAVLTVIDPLAAAFAGDENNRGEVRAFMSDWDHWGRERECTVLLVSHPPKSGAAYSGSTDWHGAARSVWTLGVPAGREASPAPPPKLACIKTNYGPLPRPLALSNWHWWEARPWEERALGGGNGARRSYGGQDQRFDKE